MVQTAFVRGFVHFNCRLKGVIIGWLHRRLDESDPQLMDPKSTPKILRPASMCWAKLRTANEDVAAVGEGGVGGSKVDRTEDVGCT